MSYQLICSISLVYVFRFCSYFLCLLHVYLGYYFAFLGYLKTSFVLIGSLILKRVYLATCFSMFRSVRGLQPHMGQEANAADEFACLNLIVFIGPRLPLGAGIGGRWMPRSLWGGGAGRPPPPLCGWRPWTSRFRFRDNFRRWGSTFRLANSYLGIMGASPGSLAALVSCHFVVGGRGPMKTMRIRHASSWRHPQADRLHRPPAPSCVWRPCKYASSWLPPRAYWQHRPPAPLWLEAVGRWK